MTRPIAYRTGDGSDAHGDDALHPPDGWSAAPRRMSIRESTGMFGDAPRRQDLPGRWHAESCSSLTVTIGLRSKTIGCVPPPPPCENPGMVLGGRREQTLDRLPGAHVDVLVIGAGAIGASTALHAARAGATVAVVDRGDLAGGTSSASSKLVHGGLRYLAMGDLVRVGQAHAERRANAEVVAPHLVWPLEF